MRCPTGWGFWSGTFFNREDFFERGFVMSDVIKGLSSDGAAVADSDAVIREGGPRPAVNVIEEIRKPGIVKRIASWLLTIEIIVLAVVALTLFGGAPFGINTYGVLSGSMEPAIQTGALVFVDTKVECEDMAPGDVAAFDIGDGTVCTHRIVEVDQEARTIVTKGDANENVDLAPVPFDSVFGESIGSIPVLGEVLLAFSEYRIPACIGLGCLTAALACLALLLPDKKTYRRR